MKKKLILTTVILLSYLITKAEASIYADASYLKEKISGITNNIMLSKDVNELLLPYYPGVAIGNINAALLNQNPFFNGLFVNQAGADISSDYISNSLSSIGGADVTTFADALARFMVKRVKQELTITFFEQFKKDLDDPRFSDLKILFPMTFKSLSAIDKEIYQYSAYINTLREAFSKDISQIVLNIPKVWQQEKYVAFFKTRPEILECLKIANELSSVLRSGKHPGDAIHSLAFSNSSISGNDGLDNYKNSVKLLDLFSQSFRTSEAGKYWVSSNSISQLSTDPVLRRIYLGLFFQKEQEYNIRFAVSGTNYTLHQLLIDNAGAVTTDLNQFIDFAINLAPKINDVEVKLKLVTEKEGKVEDEKLYDLFQSFLDLTEYAFEIDKLTLVTVHVPDFVIPEYYKTAVYIGRLANETYIDIAKKHYNSAIVNAGSIVDTVLGLLDIDTHLPDVKSVLSIVTSTTLRGQVKPGKETDIYNFIQSSLKAESKDELIAMKSAFDKLKKDITDPTVKNEVTELIGMLLTNKNETIGKLIKYGTLAANLASAKTAEEAEAAIEGISLPAGSAKIKRESRFNVSLNGYCGLYGGLERQQFVYEEKTTAINSFGVTAPVGVAISWGARKFLFLPRKKDGHNSYSIFLSVIDIGAIASFRFQNDTVKTLSKIELKDIISPGIFFSWGIPQTPLSLNLGYQLTPFLREVNPTDNTFKASYQRFSFSLVVDIPMINLYNKPRNN